MPAPGQYWWECNFGPRYDERKKRVRLANLPKQTARNRMGLRGEPFRHKEHEEAVKKLVSRHSWSTSEQVVQSQMLVTKKRLRAGSYYPVNADEVRRASAALQKVDQSTGVGETVRFVPQGPRRARSLACGFFLRFIGQKFVAVERRRRGDAQRLDQIFVVPAEDCWVA
jgi:hypothetical protein